MTGFYRYAKLFLEFYEEENMNLQQFLERLDREDVQNLDWQFACDGSIRANTEGGQLCPLDAVRFLEEDPLSCLSLHDIANQFPISEKDRRNIIFAADDSGCIPFLSTRGRLRAKMIEILKPKPPKDT